MFSGYVVFVLFFTFHAFLCQHPDRAKAIRKEKEEYRKSKKFFESDKMIKQLRDLMQTWEDSAKLPPVKLTKKQKEYWRDLAVDLSDDFEDDEEQPEEDDKVTATRGKRAAIAFKKLLGRSKRQGTCESIPNPKKRRKEWRQLSPTKRQNYINAFRAVDAFIPDPGDPNTSAFDLFVLMHTGSSAPGAHRGAAFLPWHREFLWRFRNAIWKTGGYNSHFPYYDSALDQTLPNPRDSAIFMTDPRGIGTNSGDVDAPWNLSPPISGCGPSVTRNIVSAGQAHNMLYTRTKYSIINAKSCFRDLTQGWDGDMEGFHNTGHVFFLGTMISVPCSPSDPVFWMHHANVDCLWEDYRLANQNAEERALEYPLSQTGTDPLEMGWNSVMKPFDDWGLYNAHGMSNHYGNYYYSCSPKPSSIVCSTTTDCVAASVDSNPLLWCETSTGFCHGKIGVGGVCDSAWPNEQCWCANGNPSCNVNQCNCT